MEDYYRVLEVHPDASIKDVKKAFRKKIKIIHPDINKKDDETVRIILEAYKILSNPYERRLYDRGRLRVIRNDENASFDYRVWLKQRLNEPEYVAKLVFYDLLHNHDDEALELYDTIKNTEKGRLERFFERSEAMDAEFCIVEEYIKRGRLNDAFSVMCKLIRMEKKKPGFGYFYEIVLQTFKTLVLNSMSKVLEPDRYLEILDDAIALKSSATLDVAFNKKREAILRESSHNKYADFY